MAKLDETLFTVMEVFMRFADCDVVLMHQKTMFLNKKNELKLQDDPARNNTRPSPLDPIELHVGPSPLDSINFKFGPLGPSIFFFV